MSEVDYEKYLDSALLVGGEELPGEQESAEVGVYMPTLPGKYISMSRGIRASKEGKLARQQKDGHLGFLLEFTGGIQTPSGQTFENGRYPQTFYLSTSPRDVWFQGVQQFETDGVTPKKQSSAAKYLRLTGFDPKTKNLRQIIEMVNESLTKPVGVVISLRERQPKLEDGTYAQKYKYVTNAKSYQTADGRFVPEVTLDGVTYKAQSYVVDFCKVPA